MLDFITSSYLQNIIDSKLANTESLDLTKKEDVDKFNNAIAELREMSSSFDDITKLLTGQTWNEMLDDIQKVANEPYTKILAQQKAEELTKTRSNLHDAIEQAWGIDKNVNEKQAEEINNIIRKEVDRTSKNIKKDVTKVAKRPSDYVDAKHKERIQSLVEEYSKTMIEPYFNGDKKIVANANEGMFEFACWLLNHK